MAIAAASQRNTGVIRARDVYLGGALVNGLTDYRYQTPAALTPPPDLAPLHLPAGAVASPVPQYLFASASRLALLVPGLDAGVPALLDPFLENRWLAQMAADYGFAPLDRERLLAAARRLAQAEGLAPGIALSPDQIAKLQEPILWYVEETVPGPDGTPVTARVPHLYLPEVSRAGLTVWAGGSVEGERVTLAADHIRNTGVIAAQDLDIEADTLRNEKRSASIGEIRQYGADGYWRLTGDTVQPGGFIRAARLQLNVRRIDSVSGEFWAGGREISPELGQRLGEAYTYRANQDHIRSEWVSLKKRSGLEQVAVMAVSIAVAYYTGGAAAGALGFTEGSASYAIASASLGSMASQAVTGALTGHASLDSVLRSGLTSAATAGLTQWAGQALNNATLTQTRQVGDALKAAQTATDLSGKLIGYTVRAGVTAGVNQMVYGQDAGSFGTAFVNSFVVSAAADAARFIGDNTGAGRALGEMGSPQHVLAHAALGCAAAALSGKDCASGAIGAGASAFADSLLPDPDSPAQRALMAGALTFIGGATGQAAGLDGVTAAQAATNEAVNNRLLHQKEITLIKSRAKDFARRLNGGKEPTPEQIAQAETRLLDQADRNVDQHSDSRLDGDANRYLTDLKRELVKAGQDILPGGGQYFFASPDQYFNDRMYAETLNTPTGQQAYSQIAAGQTGQYLPGYYYKQGIADANQEAKRQAVAGAVTAGAILAPMAAGACLTNPVVCNQIGITTAEVLSEGGVVAGGVFAAKRVGSVVAKAATSSGIRVTEHSVEQKINRQVRSADELDALKNPLDVRPVKIDSLGRPSQRYIGERAEVAINPETGRIVSVNPTSSKKAERLLRQREREQ